MESTQLSLPLPDAIVRWQNDPPPERLGATGRSPAFSPASGEKSKARDIIAAIRALKAIEDEQRLATQEEKQVLARFAGFGPVALSIFPDPVTGRYKDASWQSVGEELKALLTPEEYDSAKRSTFDAFYTSPIVMAAMHEAISRLGVPSNALALEPGCGIGNFMSQAPQGMRFIGVELDSISGRIARMSAPRNAALPPRSRSRRAFAAGLGPMPPLNRRLPRTISRSLPINHRRLNSQPPHPLRHRGWLPNPRARLAI